MALTMTQLKACIFDPNAPAHSAGIYAFMVPGPAPGVLVCQFGGETLEGLKAQGRVSPEAFVCPWEEAEARSRDLARSRLCRGPERVTRERWWELLEVLYPARWEMQLGGNKEHEVFMMPECITSTLYTFGVRIGEDYFTINEDCDIPAEKLIELCKEAA